MSSCVSRSVRSANETSSNGTFSVENWWETLTSLDIGDLERYVPQNVKKFVYDTYEDGKDIAYDLYSDIHEEVVEKTQSNVDDFSKFVENLVEEVESIQAEEQKLFLQEEPVSKEEMERRNKEISESKTKLRQLADNIKEEMKRDEESKEPLERAIQQFITYTRSLISSQFYSMEFMWGKVRQAEGTSYKALEFVAKNANEVKALVKDLFEKLSTIDISILGNRKKVPEVPRNME